MCVAWQGLVPGTVVAGGGEVEGVDGGPPDEWSRWSQCPTGTRVVGLKHLTVHERSCVSAQFVAPTLTAAAVFMIAGEVVDISGCSAVQSCVVVINSDTLAVVSATSYEGGDTAQLVADLQALPAGTLVLIGLHFGSDGSSLGVLKEAVVAAGGELEDTKADSSRALMVRTLVGSEGGTMALVVLSEDIADIDAQLCPYTPYSVNSVECHMPNPDNPNNGCRAFCLGKSCTVQAMCLKEAVPLQPPQDPNIARHRRRRSPDSRRRVDRRRQVSEVSLAQLGRGATTPLAPLKGEADAFRAGEASKISKAQPANSSLLASQTQYLHEQMALRAQNVEIIRQLMEEQDRILQVLNSLEAEKSESMEGEKQDVKSVTA